VPPEHSHSEASLPITGERTVPGVPEENYWFRRHEVVYQFGCTLVRGSVLDAGCGEGYGAAQLAQSGELVEFVLGLDYDPATIAHAATTYPAARFVRGNVAALPLAAESIDTLVCLQVIEHLWDQRQFVAECRRVLRPGGVLLLSTPNRLTFSPGQDRPTNLFHSHEFTATELAALVRSGGFSVDSLLGLHPAPRLRELDARYGGSFADAQLAASPTQWPAALRTDVASVSVADFALGPDDAGRALDVVVVARR
jgi:SAM-dependent methyltransferase